MMPTFRGWFALTPLSAVSARGGTRATLCGETMQVERCGEGVSVVARTGRGRVIEGQVREGMVFAWYDPDGGPPAFELPHQPSAGWSSWRFSHVDVAASPATIMRDIVDREHLETVHGYADPVVVEGPEFQDDMARVGVCFGWDTGLPGPLGFVSAAFQSTCHGLGYQCTETQSLGQRYQTRHLVLPSPLDADTTRVHLGVGARWLNAEGAVEGPIVPRLARRFAAVAFQRDVRRDMRLWEALPSVLPPAAEAPSAQMAAYCQWARRYSARSVQGEARTLAAGESASPNR